MACAGGRKSSETSDDVPYQKTVKREEGTPKEEMTDNLESLGAVGGVSPESDDHGEPDRHKGASPRGGARIDRANMKRKSKTLTLQRKKTDKTKDPGKKSNKFWTFRLKKKFPVRLRKDTGLVDPTKEVESPPCVCTGYKKMADQQQQQAAGVVFDGKSAIAPTSARASPLPSLASRINRLSMGAGPGPSGLVRVSREEMFQIVPAPPDPPPHLDMNNFNPDDFPTVDVHALLIAQRARDMEQGIEVAANQSGHVSYPAFRYCSSTSSSSTSSSSGSSTGGDPLWSLTTALNNQCLVTAMYPGVDGGTISCTEDSHYDHYGAISYQGEDSLYGEIAPPQSTFIPRTVHTQIDYMHCLVPDLLHITNCSFYWGVMDRYEAEKLLENRPEGTFLLRDSAQEEFLFSVSFRRYGRSLHARIEQWNHRFSFDSHDPGVFASDTVCGLIEHYKDPTCCMFFEPMLTIPLNRSYPFSLQHLCRAVACTCTTYDGINFLPLPKRLKEYLKYYHYKQKVRVRRFEIQH